ncbi:hypothetical protein [Faecalibacter bovis]|uniref:FUSC family protein n=1 Tax=Faecalibacter bovis TaxID=2898187 RepID=A0ABX7XCM7_9FLAO|nr:hypothetical protein [Faecalibacter bovis]QTV05552.1 hypothetical protein J9309_12395 [Faecalibacter bovis]
MIFFSKVICCFVIYWLTYHLNNTRKWGSVKASATLAVLIGLCYQLSIKTNFNTEFLKDYFLIMMGATFMGMIAKNHQHQKIDFIISSFIFCTLYEHISNMFSGFGGLLGTIACISVLCVFGLEKILNFKKF